MDPDPTAVGCVALGALFDCICFPVSKMGIVIGFVLLL